MTTPADTAPAPMPTLDTLLALAPKGDAAGWQTLVCVVLAQINGATWESFATPTGDTAWRCATVCDRAARESPDGGIFFTLWPGGTVSRGHLPNPFTDDGEAYRLETRETLAILPPTDIRGWWCWFGTDPVQFARHPDRRIAAVLATLQKHAATEAPWAPLCRWLLENRPAVPARETVS